MTTRKVDVYYKGEGDKEVLKKDYLYDTNVWLLTHVENLCALFGVKGEPQNYTLQFRVEENESSQRSKGEGSSTSAGGYLDYEEGTNALEKLVDGVELNLRIVPSVRAMRAVDILNDAAGQQPLRLKEIMFEMRFELKVIFYQQLTSKRYSSSLSI